MMDRRNTVRKTLVAMTLGLMAVLVLAAPALAGRTWCARDPIVRINGHDTQLWVAIPQEYVSLVTGAISIQILTAKPVTSEVLFLDEGFNGYGEKVTFGALKGGKVYADGSFDNQLKVQVPINTKKMKSIPLQLTFTVGGDAMTTDTGTVAYSGGMTFVVEMTNNNTSLSARFPGN